jgi:hypothetical protein
LLGKLQEDVAAAETQSSAMLAAADPRTQGYLVLEEKTLRSRGSVVVVGFDESEPPRPF